MYYFNLFIISRERRCGIKIKRVERNRFIGAVGIFEADVHSSRVEYFTRNVAVFIRLLSYD